MKTLLKSLRQRARSLRVERTMERKTRRAYNRWIDAKGYLICQNTDEVAESMGISASQLKYFLKESGKKPFLVLRKELRLKEAMAIIKKDPERKLEAVAVDVGIMDVRNLRRQFEETTGMSLSEWRSGLQMSKKKDKFVGYIKCL